MEMVNEIGVNKKQRNFRCSYCKTIYDKNWKYKNYFFKIKYRSYPFFQISKSSGCIKDIWRFLGASVTKIFNFNIYCISRGDVVCSSANLFARRAKLAGNYIVDRPFFERDKNERVLKKTV